MDEAGGILEKVDLLGQSFDVQTEWVARELGIVRTTIFHRGEVAARRESRLPDSAEDGSTDLPARMRRQHGKVLSQFVERTLGFEARSAGAELELDELPTQSREAQTEVPELPPIPEDPALADAIEVRKLYGQLLRRLELAPMAEDEADWKGWLGKIGRRLGVRIGEKGNHEHLEKARLGLSWVVVQPGFRRLRVEEQVLFRLLREKIDAWKNSGEAKEEVDELWAETLKLCDYLREVNLRADLVDFDRRLLDWILAHLERGGGFRRVHRFLRWIEGRDVALDDLLGLGDEACEEDVQAALHRVRAGL